MPAEKLNPNSAQPVTPNLAYEHSKNIKSILNNKKTPSTAALIYKGFSQSVKNNAPFGQKGIGNNILNAIPRTTGVLAAVILSPIMFPIFKNIGANLSKPPAKKVTFTFDNLKPDPEGLKVAISDAPAMYQMKTTVGIPTDPPGKKPGEMENDDMLLNMSLITPENDSDQDSITSEESAHSGQSAFNKLSSSSFAENRIASNDNSEASQTGSSNSPITNTLKSANGSVEKTKYDRLVQAIRRNNVKALKQFADDDTFNLQAKIPGTNFTPTELANALNASQQIKDLTTIIHV